MKNPIHITALLLVIGLIGAWYIPSSKYIQKVKWLEGTWENKTSRGSMFETWKWVNEMEISGKSYVLKEQDTVVMESIRLVEEQENLFYIPTVRNQNNAQPIRFVMKHLTDTSMVFENPSHDFPQVIAYRMVHSDSLVAEISGVRNGEERKITFPMKRISKK